MEETKQQVLLFRKVEQLRSYYNQTATNLFEQILFQVIAFQIFVFFPIVTINYPEYLRTILPFNVRILEGWHFVIVMPGLVVLFLLSYHYHTYLVKMIPEGQLSKLANIALLVLFSFLLSCTYFWSYLWLLFTAIVLFAYWLRTGLLAKNLRHHLESSVRPVDQLTKLKAKARLEYFLLTKTKKLTYNQYYKVSEKIYEIDKNISGLENCVVVISKDMLEDWRNKGGLGGNKYEDNEKQKYVIDFLSKSSLYQQLYSTGDGSVFAKGRWRKNIILGAFGTLTGGLIVAIGELFVVLSGYGTVVPDVVMSITYIVHGCASLFLLFAIVCGGVEKISAETIKGYKTCISEIHGFPAVFVSTLKCLILLPFFGAVNDVIAHNTLYGPNLEKYTSELNRFVSRFVIVLNVRR